MSTRPLALDNEPYLIALVHSSFRDMVMGSCGRADLHRGLLNDEPLFILAIERTDGGTKRW